MVAPESGKPKKLPEKSGDETSHNPGPQSPETGGTVATKLRAMEWIAARAFFMKILIKFLYVGTWL